MREQGVVDPDAVRAAHARMIGAASEDDAREILEAASSITRIKILRGLAASPLAAGDIARVIGRSRAATSQHLAVLRRLGAISPTRSGNVVRYRLTNDVAARVLVAIANAFDALSAKTR